MGVDPVPARVEAVFTSAIPFDFPALEADLIADCALDSLDLFEFRVALEEEFSVEIADSDWASVRTLEQVITIIHQTTAKN